MAEASQVNGSSVIGQRVSTDPYLAYQPAFAYTLPIQLFVNGITLTLLVVLLIHLLFTTQYHYPLAPLNYSLQLSSILVVIASVIVKTFVILHHSGVNADSWPYDLDYIAVTIPPESWSVGEDAAWFLLQALNVGLANITHIQFLTLLYPSRTEARLIIFILGPLAIASSGLVFTALTGSQTILDVGDAIRNVLNSTLLLIFSSALAIWGLLVNRRRAWRTDGGTAVFGFGALFLAVVSTSVNFVAVAEDGIDWLQHLLYAAVLWQTWLGWWWWVGSGMGIGEVEDIMARAEKKKRKAARRASRLRSQGKNADGSRPGLRHRASTLTSLAEAPAAAMAGFTTSVAGILRNRSSTLTRRHNRRSEAEAPEDIEEGVVLGGGGTTAEPESIAMQPVRSRRSATGNTTTADPGTGAHVEFSVSTPTPPGSRSNHPVSTNSETSSTSATPSLHPPKTLAQFLTFPSTWLFVYFRQIRRAHEDAAKQQALERAIRRDQVFAKEVTRRAGLAHGGEGDAQAIDVERRGSAVRAVAATVEADAARLESEVVNGDGVGWGLGSFGIREHQESAKRLQVARDRLQGGRLLGNEAPPGRADEPGPTSGLEGEEGDRARDGPAEAGPSTRRRREEEGHKEEGEGQWEDVDTSSDETPKARGRWRRGGKKTTDAQQREGGRGEAARTGWSWWGPLRDWRLADRSAF